MNAHGSSTVARSLVTVWTSLHFPHTSRLLYFIEGFERFPACADTSFINQITHAALVARELDSLLGKFNIANKIVQKNAIKVLQNEPPSLSFHVIQTS